MTMKYHQLHTYLIREHYTCSRYVVFNYFDVIVKIAYRFEVMSILCFSSDSIKNIMLSPCNRHVGF